MLAESFFREECFSENRGRHVPLCLAWATLVVFRRVSIAAAFDRLAETPVLHGMVVSCPRCGLGHLRKRSRFQSVVLLRHHQLELLGSCFGGLLSRQLLPARCHGLEHGPQCCRDAERVWPRRRRIAAHRSARWGDRVRQVWILGDGCSHSGYGCGGAPLNVRITCDCKVSTFAFAA